MADPKKPGTRWRTVIRRSNADMLFAEDLGGYGCKPIDVEIIDSGVTKVKKRGGTTDMPWLQFRGKKGPSKKLGCGAGMCKVMQTITGTDIIEAWRGWITLIVVKTTYTDEVTKEKLETDAIRIAPRRPNRPDANAASRISDEPVAPDPSTPAAEAPPRDDEPAFDPSDVQPEDRHG